MEVCDYAQWQVRKTFHLFHLALSITLFADSKQLESLILAHTQAHTSAEAMLFTYMQAPGIPALSTFAQHQRVTRAKPHDATDFAA